MPTTNKTLLITALVVVAGLFLLFGFGAMSGAMMNGGWMGTGWMDGNGMMGNGWMTGISWMWIPTLLALGFGVVLGWALFGRRVGPVPATNAQVK